MNKKLVVNIGSSISTQIIQILVNIVLPPLIIFTFGSEINGLTSSVKQIVAYVSIIGLGISSVGTQALYKPFLNKDLKQINGILNSTGIMFRKAGFIYSAILIIVSIFYPFALDSTLSYFNITFVVLAIGLSGVSEFFVVGKYRALLYADQKVYIYNIIQAIGLLMSFIIAIILIRLGFGIVVVQLGLSSIYIFRVLFIKYYVQKNYRFLDSSVERIDQALNKKNDALIHQLSGLAVGSTQVLFLGFFVGLNIASIYAVYSIVFSGFYSILSLSINSIAPFMGRTFASEDLSKIKKEFNNYERGFVIIITLIYSMTAALIYSFISIYTKNADIVYQDKLLSILFVTLGLFTAIRLPSQMIINVAGHFKETRNRAIIEALICVSLQLILIPKFGIYGALIGTLASAVWRAFDVMIYARRLTHQKSFSIVFYLLLSSTVIVLTYLVFDALYVTQVNSYGDWIISAIFCGFISVVLIIPVIFIYYKKELKNYFTKEKQI